MENTTYEKDGFMMLPESPEAIGLLPGENFLFTHHASVTEEDIKEAKKAAIKTEKQQRNGCQRREINGKIQKVMKILLTAIEILWTAFTYEIMAYLIMGLYAGVITRNKVIFFVTGFMAAVIFFLTVLPFFKQKKRRKISKKSLLPYALSIILFASAFFTQYVYERPSIDEINHTVQRATVYASEIDFSMDFQEYKDVVHTFDVTRLQLLSDTVALMGIVLDVSEQAKMYLQDPEYLEENEEEVNQWIENEKSIMQDQMAEVEGRSDRSGLRSALTFLFMIVASILWKIAHVIEKRPNPTESAEESA